jgi:DNA-binding transcriptional MerR regulator
VPSKNGSLRTAPTPPKLYFRIGEVARIVGVQPHVLRYWETEFRSIRPEKSSKGHRVYSRRDVAKLLRVKDLLRNQGFTIAGARKRLREISSAGHCAPGELETAFAAERAASGETDASGVDPAFLAGQGGTTAPAQDVPTHGLSAGLAPGEAKSLRRELVAIRAEITRMLRELQAEDGRPDSR